MKKQELIYKLKLCRLVDETKKIIIRKLDYSQNMLSPVDVVYSVTYFNLSGNKCNTLYFGEHIGFQG